MSYDLTDSTEVPAVNVGREPKANELLGPVQSLAVDMRKRVEAGEGKDSGRSVIITTKDADTVKAARRDLQRAGNKVGVTVRVKEAHVKGTYTLTFWVVPKITKPRKDKTAE